MVMSLSQRAAPHTPPVDFNPLTASDEELSGFAIMPRPDRASDPVGYQYWLRLFGAPATFVVPQGQEVQARFLLRPTSPSQKLLSINGASRYQTSRNWSGAYIVPTDATKFVLVAGQWTIPKLAPPSVSQEPGTNEYVCSTWVGLDGQRRYLNSSLPQAGTMQTLTVDGESQQTSAIAFFQWWDVETGGTFLHLTGLPVKPGDEMVCAVWAQSATRAIGYLRNDSTRQMAIVSASAPFVALGKNPPVELMISGGTAEWVLERPMVFGESSLYAFPNFGTTTFTCWAGAARSSGSPQVWHDLRQARFIRLYEARNSRLHTAFLSMPAKLRGDDQVEVHYGTVWKVRPPLLDSEKATRPSSNSG